MIKMENTRVIEDFVEIPEGIEVSYKKPNLVVKGPKGENIKALVDPKVSIIVQGSKVIFKAEKASKREKTKIGTFKAHLKNLIKGVQDEFEYKLKICSGHFPMNVAMQGKELIVKNFLGEKVPRVLKLKEGADVKIDGQLITVRSTNKEIAGQIAADIEQLCRITNRDRRKFQDGIYIINKAGKQII
jgi:large subunit ribosomal protein L6